MSSLLLLRHGQASFGTDDYDRLSDLGECQASATGAYLATAGTVFDRVLIGPKRRHRATAAGALAALPTAPGVVIEPALDEFAEGTEVLRAAQRMCGLSSAELAALPRNEQLRHYEAAIMGWLRGEEEIEGRASAAAFRACVADWLRELVAQPARGQRVLAVTSAGVIAAAVAEVLDIRVEHMAQFTRVVRNASLTEIVFSPVRTSLMSFNSVAHLPPALASSM
jgi:broad specificity phosphatase PhoE